MASIFDRLRLRPSQLRTIAGRRYADADYLRRSGRNLHANGAMYLGGFVIECLLKARLLEKHAWLRAPIDPAARPPRDRRLHWLVYREHDLEGLLAELGELRRELLTRGGYNTDGPSLLDMLKEVCGEWTIYARYSPRQADIREAGRFLDRVRELRQWLA